VASTSSALITPGTSGRVTTVTPDPCGRTR
jgi:hypothetical protein